MCVVNSCDPEEHEDDGLAGGGQHLDGVLDGGLGLGGHVPLDVVLHGDAAEGDGEDAGHVEDLGGEVGQVRHGDYHKRLQDTSMVHEPGGLGIRVSRVVR